MTAWAAVQAGKTNPLVEALSGDPRLAVYASREQLSGWLDASEYVGDASQRARRLAEMIRAEAAGH